MEPSLQPPGRISCPRLTSLQWVLFKFLFPCLAMFFSRHGEAELRQITLTMTPIPLELRYQRRLVCHIFIDILLESPSNITWNWPAKRGQVVVTPLRTNSAKYYLTTSLYKLILWTLVLNHKSTSNDDLWYIYQFIYFLFSIAMHRAICVVTMLYYICTPRDCM